MHRLYYQQKIKIQPFSFLHLCLYSLILLSPSNHPTHLGSLFPPFFFVRWITLRYPSFAD
eukprot:UN13532